MNRNKARGTAFETAGVDYLTANGSPDAHRVALHGNQDRGDVHLTEWALQFRNLKTLDLAGAVDDARKQAAAAKKPHFAAVLKRRGKGIHGAYVVLPMEQFAVVVGRLR